jgi:hypothetical protein
MKIIKLLSVFIFIIYGAELKSQLRIDPAGNTGFGTNYPNPGYKCHIKGNLLLSTHPEIPACNSTFVELKLKVGNGCPGAEIGTNIGNIDFWSTEWGYNSLKAANYYTSSDSSLKTNIVPVKGALDKLKKLRSYSYQFKSDIARNKSDQSLTYGFLAQEVEQIIPNITTESRGIKLIDYQQVIPLLVNALQEQNKTIEDLTTTVDDLKEKLNSCCNASEKEKKDASGTISQNTSVLYQNHPNPFSEKTIIEYHIITEMSTAAILIFDMQGSLKKTYKVTKNGKGEIIIYGNELKAGMYLYSLIVDNKEVDTKRMILND